jgi:hypothetical protein
VNQFKDKILQEFEGNLYRCLNMSLSQYLGIFQEHGEDPMAEIDEVFETEGPNEFRLYLNHCLNGLSVVYLETELGREMTFEEIAQNADRLKLPSRYEDYERYQPRIPKRLKRSANSTLRLNDFDTGDFKKKATDKSVLKIWCGECQQTSTVSAAKILATKSLDHWQVHSFFRDWMCPECKTPTDYRRYYLDDEMIIEAELVIDEGRLDQL